MNFNQYMIDNAKVLNEGSEPITTIKPVPSTTAISTMDKPVQFKVGSLRDSIKFYNNKPVKIINKAPDSPEQIWVEVKTGDEKGLEIQVSINDLSSVPNNLDNLDSLTNESTESNPEGILKNAFNYLTKNSHKLNDKKDIELFNKVKNIMTIYKKTKHLDSLDIDFLKKEVAPLFEELLLGDEE